MKLLASIKRVVVCLLFHGRYVSRAARANDQRERVCNRCNLRLPTL